MHPAHRFAPLLLLAASSLAQSPQQITVKDVIALHNSGIADDIVIMRIRMHNVPAELSTDDLIQLKQAHVNDAVVRAMLDPAAVPAMAPNASVVTVQNAAQDSRANLNPSGATPGLGNMAHGDPDDPRSPHDSGIYLQRTGSDGKQHLVEMEKTSFAGRRLDGTFSINVLANLSRKQASLRTAAGSPVFFFYFENKAAGLDQSVPGEKASNPDGFLLLHLNQGKNDRTAAIGHLGFGGVRRGPHPDTLADFRSERLAPGLYRVTAAHLQPGEYAFVRATDLAGMQPAIGEAAVTETPLAYADLFDFGVDAP